MNWDKWAPGLRYLKPREKMVYFLAVIAFIAFIWIFPRADHPYVPISQQPIYWIALTIYMAVLLVLWRVQWKRGLGQERLGPMKVWEKVAVVSLPLALAIYWLVFNPPMPIIWGAAAAIVTVELAFACRQWWRKRQEKQRDHV